MTPLSARDATRTSARVSQVPEIFDRALRRLRRDRAAAGFADHAFLRDFMLDGILDRLGAVRRDFVDVLDLGCFDGAFALPGATIARIDAGSRFARAADARHADEDAAALGEGQYDLVISAGVLDQVNDLPGALVQIRRALRPDGLFLGAFAGAGSLAALRAAFRAAEPGTTRIHPQVDVRAAGDLLLRAGFALPVADTETLAVRYASLLRLIGDLRGMAATSLLHGRTYLSRATLAAAVAAFDAAADPDGRTTERFEVVFLTGWAPAPDQPRPARRGSATASLADALKPR